MEKLRDYFAKRKESTDDLNGADGDEPVAFPTLDPQEEEQVYKTLGIDENKVQGKNAKDVILGTLRSLKQVKVAGAENAEAAGTTSDESEAETELVGTVRIKSNGGSDKFGTLRRNKKNELLLEELSNMSTDDSSEDAYGTFKINNDYSSDDSYGTMKISDIASDDRPSWMSKSSDQPAKPLVWRAPEEWELAIISLERGEWSDSMNPDAFHRYKKERPKLSSLSSRFFVVEQSNSAPNSAPSSPTSTDSPKKKKKEKKDKKDSEIKDGGSAEKKKKHTRKASKTDTDEVRSSQSAPVLGGADGSKKERKWAVFKRSAENRIRESE